MALDEQLRTQLSDLVANNRVVLFMKGTRHFPQCGFSATVTQILDGLLDEYHTVNVLKEPAIREGIKEYSNWPTIPQLYVEGKLVGGCDIVRELFQSGELQELLGVQPATTDAANDTGAAPTITITPAAKQALEEMRQGDAGTLRLEVSARFEHGLSLDDATEGDLQVDAGGITMLVDRASAKRANGVSIDFVVEGGGFRIDNPNEPARVRQLAPVDLKRMLDAGEPVHLYDVRMPQELDFARIEGARLFDQDAIAEIAGLAPEAVLVFYCHHGNRSHAAAERFVQEGFTHVHNLVGGIDRWSQDVDPSVPRY